MWTMQNWDKEFQGANCTETFDNEQDIRFPAYSRQKSLRIWLLLGDRLVLDPSTLEKRAVDSANHCLWLLLVWAPCLKRQMNIHTTCSKRLSQTSHDSVTDSAGDQSSRRDKCWEPPCETRFWVRGLGIIKWEAGRCNLKTANG